MTPTCKTIVEIYRALGATLTEQEYSIERTRAGRHQQDSGALLWFLRPIDGHSALGSWERATDIVKAWRTKTLKVTLNFYSDYDVLALETDRWDAKPRHRSNRRVNAV